MTDLRPELEDALEAIHAAIDRGDRETVAARLIDPVDDLELLRTYLPRPSRQPFVGVLALTPRTALYAVIGDEPSADVAIADLFLGRDGVWRASSSTAQTSRAMGESHISALKRFAEMKALALAPPVPPAHPRAWSAPRRGAAVSDVLRLGIARRGIPPAEIDDAEQTLATRFPAGYREYVGELGESLDSDFARVFPPARVASELESWRRRIDAYWFWAPGADGFGQEEAYESFVVADTLDGDELVFHPRRAGVLYLLPRHAEEIARVEGTFLEALAWMCESGDLGSTSTVRYAVALGAGSRRSFEAMGTAAYDADALGAVAEAALSVLCAADPGAIVIEIEDDHGGWTVLMPRFGGTVSITLGGDVSLSFDPAAPSKELAKLEGALRRLGLVERVWPREA